MEFQARPAFYKIERIKRSASLPFRQFLRPFIIKVMKTLSKNPFPHWFLLDRYEMTCAWLHQVLCNLSTAQVGDVATNGSTLTITNPTVTMGRYLLRFCWWHTNLTCKECYLSGWLSMLQVLPFAATISPISVVSVAHLFFDVIFKLHGLLETIISHRDAVSTSLFWE